MRCLLSFLLCLPFQLLQAAIVLEQPVSLDYQGLSLQGSLLIPNSPHPVPLAILHPGSGPTDRNGNQQQAHNDSLQKIARALAEHGIASLRYDKRGVAKSTAAAPDERELSLEAYRNDLLAWSEKMAQDPRFGPQILIGHSEGALIASLAAPASQAQALVLLAGSGRPIDQLLVDQLSHRLQPNALRYSQYLIQQIKSGHYPIPVPEPLQPILRPSVQPYLHSLFQYDPAAVFAKTQQAALIIQGDQDIQVSVEDAQRLAQARPDATLAIIPDMDHVLRPIQAGAPFANYSRSDLPLSPAFLASLFSFLADQGMLKAEVLSTAADSPQEPQQTIKTDHE